MQRAVTLSLVLVFTAILIAYFLGENRRTHETSGAYQASMRLLETATQPSTDQASDTIEAVEGASISFDEINIENTDWPRENESVSGESPAPERVLSQMMADDIGLFKQRLEAYHLAGGADDEWSGRAAEAISSWFQDGDELFVDCAADICAMDLFVTYDVYLKEYRTKARQWGEADPEGFMQVGFFFKENDGSIRSYFFRDMFDPESL